MLHIFTFGTDINKLSYLKQTENIFNNNINYIIVDKWNGYIDKLLYMKNAIKNIPKEDIICFIDGYDVLSNSNNDSILNKFFSYDCDLLIGSELNCFPENYKTQMETLNTNNINNYKYINSGGYIGYNKNITDMLNWKTYFEIDKICKNGGDQSYVIEYYLNNLLNNNIKLDIYCKIFQNMHWVSWNDIIFINGFVYNLVMKEYPCFIHFNGGTFQTNKNENIMPIFIEKIVNSKTSNLNLNDYNQIITTTCFPHNQI